MALKTHFKLAGDVIKLPLNYQELSLELNFDKDDPDYRGQVSTNAWELGLGDANDGTDGANIAIRYVNSGNIFDGIPFRIDLSYGTPTGAVYENVFDGYLDLPNAEFLCDRIKANSVEKKGIDWLNEVADSFTFEYLATSVADGGAGTITETDYVLIPYQLNSQTNKLDTAILLLSGYSILNDILGSVQLIEELIVAIESSGGTAFGNIASVILIVLRLLLLIASVIIFFNNLFKYLVQAVKYKSGMYLYDLCSKGADYLGYRFESTILGGDVGRYNLPTGGSIGFDNVAVIPESYNQYEDDEGILGVFDVRDKDELKGFYRGTFGDLLRNLKTMFNAKIIIEDDNGEKVLRLERIDTDTSFDIYRIPSLDRSKSPYKYNTEELNAYYGLSYVPDLNDKNVWQDYIGTELQVITSSTLSSINNLVKGEVQHKINFSLSAIKLDLTKSEKIVRSTMLGYYAIINVAFLAVKIAIIIINGFIWVINNAIRILKTLKVIRKSTRLIAPIRLDIIRNPFQEFIDRYDDRRTEILIMENDFINTPKLIGLAKSWKDKAPLEAHKVSVVNKQLLSVQNLWNEFHYINSFVGAENNQAIIHQLSNVPFCIDDYNKLKNSNIIVDSDGVSKGEMVSLKWNIYKQTADMTFKIKKTYTEHLTTNKILSDGR